MHDTVTREQLHARLVQIRREIVELENLKFGSTKYHHEIHDPARHAIARLRWQQQQVEFKFANLGKVTAGI